MSKRNKRRRQCVTRRLPETQQGSLFPTVPAAAPPGAPEPVADFLCPRPEAIFVGAIPLRQYLADNGMGWVIRLRAELEASDLSSLLADYATTGRRAIHPVVLLGLVLYGILERRRTLRELERLARFDLGAWWMCGGLQPDHSTIGLFLQRHAAVLTEEYFVRLTRQLVRRLRLSPGGAAGDGTVIEAVASHYRLLQADAAREAAAQAPDDPQAQAAADAATAREAKARQNGDRPEAVRVNPTEPEAVVQPQKNGVRRPSYKPSVLAHETGLIVGQSVHPSDEGAAVGPWLAQHEAILGAPPTRLLLDANYHQNAVLLWLGELELDVLCPSGKADQGHWERQRRQRGAFDKAAFTYDEERDVYVCPRGQELPPVGRGQQYHLSYRRYGGAPCAACPDRALCTTDARHGRTVKRFAGDEWKEAMVRVMQQPAAQRAYRQRKALVEPVFAALRERQGLRRFLRRGLAGARLEFSLHCLAYNLGRALRLLGAFDPPLWRLRMTICPSRRFALVLFAFRPSRRSRSLYYGLLSAQFH